MTVSKALVAVALAVGVAGTSTSSAFAYPNNNAPVIVRSAQACDMYARDYANWRAGHRGTRIAASGLIGAVAGGAIGKYFFGAPVPGAVVGAGAAIALQSAMFQPQWQAEYNNAYTACVRGAPLAYPWAF